MESLKNMDHGTSLNKDASVHVQITELSGRQQSETGSSTIFEPQSNLSPVTATRPPSISAPEKKLTLLALRLAVLEKAATGLGTLGFVWATVVLLGGFAITLDKTDFWFVTIILLIEGTRIYSRSRELEWQHEATWSVVDAGASSLWAIQSSSNFMIKAMKSIFRPVAVGKPSQHGEETAENKHLGKQIQKPRSRRWASQDVPILPSPWVFLSRNVGRLLYWLQLAAAAACVTMSLIKLKKQNFGDIEKSDTDKRNRKAALNLFYSLALAEALLFLLEKAYWEWEIKARKLLEKVNKEIGFGKSGTVAITRFFYDAYSKCIDGSIFDGLKMDMVSFGMDLLASKSPDEQLIGAQILQKFATNDLFSDDTLQKIGVSISVMERLVEMLNWKDPEEEEIRRLAAEILSKLAGKKQNSLRVAGIPGAMESVSSLLHVERKRSGAADEIFEKEIILDSENYGFWTFNLLGLSILKKLARNHDNCGKIGNTRGLLPKIIDFTNAGERLLKDDNISSSQILIVKRSLQVVKWLSTATGGTGKVLRKEISEIVLTIGNIRGILRNGEKHPVLQNLGIEILTNLALEEDSKESIGSTGGVLKELFNIFFKQEMPEDLRHVRIAAGEALSMLALQSPNNCHRILKLNVVGKLVKVLETPVLRVNAANILRNLCSYYTESHCFEQLRGTTTAAPTVLGAIMTSENKLQEVMVGLAAQVFNFLTSQESNAMFERTGIHESELAHKLIEILREHRYPPIKAPRIRRFVIQLATSMMQNKRTNIQMFKDMGLEKELDSVMNTTSELESFNVFSGTVGLSRHSNTTESLVETAMQLLAEE